MFLFLVDFGELRLRVIDQGLFDESFVADGGECFLMGFAGVLLEGKYALVQLEFG
jgi:hypothetical protein